MKTLKIPTQISTKKFLIVLFITLLFAATIFYVFAPTPTDTFWVTGGVYPSEPGFTVWREGSNYFAKDDNGAIQYSGTNASDVISSALTTGVCCLKPGIYSLDSSIIIPDLDDVKLTGAGATLTVQAGFSDYVIRNEVPSVSQTYYIEISEIEINCTNAYSTALGGIHLTHVAYSRIRDVYIRQARAGYGINLQSITLSSVHNIIESVSIGECETGILFNGTSTARTNHNLIYGGAIRSSLIAASVGINFTYARTNKIITVDIDSHQYGVYLNDGSNIIDCRFEQPTSDYDVYITANGDYNQVQTRGSHAQIADLNGNTLIIDALKGMILSSPLFPTAPTLFDHFICNTLDTSKWDLDTNGTASHAITGTGGNIRLITGATLGSEAILDTNGIFPFLPHYKAIMFSMLYLEQTSDTIFRVGFYRDANTYIYWEYDSSISANWTCHTNLSGVSNSTDTGIAADTSYHRFEIHVINPTVYFYLDGQQFTLTGQTHNLASDPYVFLRNRAASNKAVRVDYYGAGHTS